MMKLEDITTDDINTIITALEMWERGDSGGEIMSSLLGLSLARTPDEKAQMEMEERRAQAKRDSERQRRRDTAILLKAKLLLCRRDLEDAQPPGAAVTDSGRSQ